MNLDELKSAFETARIVLVQVEFLEYSEESEDLQVKGSLREYIAALKALRIDVAFVYAELLEADDFLFSSEEEEGDDAGEYDLCSENPQITAFRQRIGEVGLFILYAPMQGRGLTFLVSNEWYDNFLQLREDSVATIEQKRADTASETEAGERARIAMLRRDMNGLLEDKKFTRLPTQKAMLAYAKLKIPGIGELDDGTLRTAISDLVARIAAHGRE